MRETRVPGLTVRNLIKEQRENKCEFNKSQTVNRESSSSPPVLSPETTFPRILYNQDLVPTQGLESKKKLLLSSSSWGPSDLRSQESYLDSLWDQHSFPRLLALSDFWSTGSSLLTLTPRISHWMCKPLIFVLRYFPLQITGWTVTDTGNRCPKLGKNS